MKIFAADNPNILDTPEEVFEFFKQYCDKQVWVKCYNNLYGKDVFVKPQREDSYGYEFIGPEITFMEMSHINSPDAPFYDVLSALTTPRILYSHRYVIDTSNLITLTTKELCRNYPESIESQFNRYVGKDAWVYVTSAQNRYDHYWLRILSIHDGQIEYNCLDDDDILSGYVRSRHDTISSLDDISTSDVAAFVVEDPVEIMSTDELIEMIRNCEESPEIL